MKGKIDQILVFEVGGQTFGMDVDLVVSVNKEQALTSMPQQIPSVLGVTWWQGMCLPVYSLRQRFGLPGELPGQKPGAVLLARSGIPGDKLQVALPIDGVKEICDLKQQDLIQVPEILAAQENDYLEGVAHVGKALISLVDPGNLVPKDRRKELEEMVKKIEAEGEGKNGE